VVRAIMRAAFAEYEAVLDVPSSALSETVEDVAAHMQLGGAVLAELAGVVGPVASGRFERRDGYVYIGRLAVLPAQRGRGIGAALVGFIEALAEAEGLPEARLCVRQSLPRNLEFYQRLGYKVTATYPHPRGGEFVVDMAKRLAPR
jgi:ribosomal protein S18 acetylase RimI-like enzyme